jgi:ssDNA-binding Zn-finger/Zn-ribbon topoisomerase 1
MYSKKAYPYPEIVTGDKWHVLETTEHDSQPRTDNLNKQMYVPMDRECEYCGVNHSRMIRRHELGHAKWSPKTMGKLMRGTRADAIHALEEVRINYLLEQKAKLGMDELIVCREEAENKIQEKTTNISCYPFFIYVRTIQF